MSTSVHKNSLPFLPICFQHLQEWSHAMYSERGMIFRSAKSFFKRIRPDTRLPHLRVVGQGQYQKRFTGHLGRSSEHKNAKKVNGRKSVRWSAVSMPCLSRLWLKLRGELGSGLKGADDLSFHTHGGIFYSFSSSSSSS